MRHGWEFLKPEDRRDILEGIRTASAPRGPYHIEFDWTDRCNVECFFCNNDVRNQGGKELSVDVVRRCLDEAIPQGLRSLRLSGGGEPLFHRKIRPLLDLIEERGLVIDNLTTNGVLLNEDIAKRLMRIGTREIIVSLNYPNPETYAEAMLTPARNFDRVIQCLEHLRREREALNGGMRPKVSLQFFVTDTTKFDIPRMAEIGKEHDVDVIALRTLDSIDPSRRIPEKDKGRIKDDLRSILMEDDELYDVNLGDEGLGLFYEELIEEIRTEKGRAPAPWSRENIEYCYMQHYSMAIRGDGGVYACCMMVFSEEIEPLGNVNESSLSEIWHGVPYQEFRGEMERAHLLETNVDPGPDGFKRIHPVCATHYDCPLGWTVCDKPFYREAEEIHQQKRKSFGGLKLRAKEKLRQFIGGR